MVLTAAIGDIDLACAAFQYAYFPCWAWPPGEWPKPFGLSDKCVALRVEPAVPEAPAGSAELFQPCPSPAEAGAKCPGHTSHVWSRPVTVVAWRQRGMDVQTQTARAFATSQTSRPAGARPSPGADPAPEGEP